MAIFNLETNESRSSCTGRAQEQTGGLGWCEQRAGRHLMKDAAEGHAKTFILWMQFSGSHCVFPPSPGRRQSSTAIKAPFSFASAFSNNNSYFLCFLLHTLAKLGICHFHPSYTTNKAPSQQHYELPITSPTLKRQPENSSQEQRVHVGNREELPCT